MSAPHDPRSVAEKARAALKRNDEMGLAVPEGPMEERVSVTPATFGETDPRRDPAPVDREDREDPLPEAP